MHDEEMYPEDFPDEDGAFHPEDFPDEEPEPARTPKLRAVGPTDTLADFPPDPDAWSPLDEAQQRWVRIQRRTADGKLRPAPQAARAYEVLACHFWAGEFQGEIYALPRTTRHRPTGGILQPLARALNAKISWLFSELDPATTCSGVAIKDAILRWKGDVIHLPHSPSTRWGRGEDGTMWWDSGRPDGQVVRYDATGWRPEAEPDTWFLRPSNLEALPLPERDGDIAELWEHANVAPDDHHLVLSWLLASVLPGQHEGVGMLYITGSSGTGKSTAMSVLTSAAGGEPNRQAQSSATTPDRDLFAVARDGWVLGIDNVSRWSDAQSDRLCTIITGTDFKTRTLFTTNDTSVIHVRRPVIATAIEVPFLQEDLVRRMIPVSLHPMAAPLDDHTLAIRWAKAQPAVFGALLDLLVRVEQLGPPPAGTHLSDLPSWGRMAWALDQLIPPPNGQSTIERCLERRTAIDVGEVLVDRFWTQAANVLRGATFKGTMSEFAALVPPPDYVDAKSWPTARGLPGLIARRGVGLKAAGWDFEKLPSASSTASKHAPVWSITPPPPDKSDGHASGCRCWKCTVEF